MEEYPKLRGTKKAEAVKIATAMLNSLGVKVSPDILNVYVEAAVRALPATAVESQPPAGAV